MRTIKRIESGTLAEMLNGKEEAKPFALEVAGIPNCFEVVEVTLETDQHGIRVVVFWVYCITEYEETRAKRFLFCSPGDDLSDVAIGGYIGSVPLGRGRVFVYHG